MKRFVSSDTLVISPPVNVRHHVHVNKDWDWHEKDDEHAFTLVERIGEGSFGSVYKGVRNGSNYELAIKVVDNEQGQSESLKTEIDILKMST